MPTNQELIAIAKRVQLGNYQPAPLVITRASGCRVYDVEGRSYLDLCAGIAVISVGHSHPEVAKAISEQAVRLTHVSNLYYNDRAIELGAELQRRTGFDRFFFCNSGAEANEALIKLSRRYHYERGDEKRTGIVSALGSFHGRTIGALSLTGEPKYQKGMAPLMGGVKYVEFNRHKAIEKAVDEKTAAVILEPIQGEGGIVVASDDYLRKVRELCDSAGALLLFDEVQTGYGRTGRFLAREHSGVMPDACSLAKGIACGFPLGAIAVTEKLAGALPPGSHAATFGGNALACAAALAVLKVFDREALVENAESVGAYLGKRLEAIATSAPEAVLEARGKGLLRGIKLHSGLNPAGVLEKIRNRGVLLSLAGGDVLRFSPPLCISAEEVDEGVEVVELVLRGVK
ncbi:MAG: acetylornithine/succinylornithine family transaminase [Deltaproteobacteria bacterium]|nr:acetylornithine/succinylornithine family transaminase [Deltaproteobacteria bacterium]